MTRFNRKDYVRALSELGLSKAEAAMFLEIDVTTSRRYVTGRLPVPAPIAMLLALMLRTETSVSQARNIAGLD